MGGRTWDGFFRTVLLDAEDGVNSAACLQVSLATLGFPRASRSPYFPFILPFSLSVSQINSDLDLIPRLYLPRAPTLPCLCPMLGQYPRRKATLRFGLGEGSCPDHS